ncbi:MAG TPA: phage holin family protein [Pseudonocardiaceae bacterium]|nr:phage holin family protein [Pseudonocardiaceae bacterium]
MTQVGQAAEAVEDRSTNELFTELSEQLRRLIHAETRLAAAELRRKGKRAGLGAAAFGLAAGAALLGGGALVACGIIALALVLPAWLAALLVGVAVLIGAGLAALLGRIALRNALPPVPTWAAASAREDVAAIAKGVRR